MTTTPDQHLAAAVLAGDAVAAATALATGADANARLAVEETWDRERVGGDEPLLQRAVRAGSQPLVAALLAHGADPGARDTVFGRSVLVEAVRGGDEEIVRMLLAAGAATGPADGGPADAFAVAIELGHGAIAERLAAAGATASPRALGLAAHRGRVDLVELCRRLGATPSADDLVAAARSGQVEAVRWLLDRLLDQGVDLDIAGGDALCEAANAGRDAVVELLLGLGVSPRCRNSYGWTPLHFAAWQATPALCERLLAAGADPLAPDDEGLTARHWAAEAGHTDIVAVLARAEQAGI